MVIPRRFLTFLASAKNLRVEGGGGGEAGAEAGQQGAGTCERSVNGSLI